MAYKRQTDRARHYKNKQLAEIHTAHHKNRHRRIILYESVSNKKRYHIFSGTLMASMDDSHYVDVYRYVLNKIDDIVSTNLDTINESKSLKKEFNSVYGEQEKKFLEIASNQYDSGSLIGTVNSNSDMKYRFYAYMLLSAKDDYQYNKNDFSSC
jgi:hypothetical protein